ncbi:MAG: SMC-Scp complex subunit ScpB [Planctomycetota bacterium]
MNYRQKRGFPGTRPGIARAWRSFGTNRNLESPASTGRWLMEELLGVATVRDSILARVEAVLLASSEPVTPRQLAKLAELPDTGEARRQVMRLNLHFDRERSSFYVEELAGGYQLLTRPELRPWLDQLTRRRDELQLSAPTLETLAIIAYRQPICRADIEAIRGVQVGELLKQLMERGLVRFAGKDDSLGRPFLYGTTKRFLEVFGLRNLHELPLVELLTRPSEQPAATGGSPTPEPTSEVDGDDEPDEE